jgi:hypothetical protein
MLLSMSGLAVVATVLALVFASPLGVTAGVPLRHTSK